MTVHHDALVLDTADYLCPISHLFMRYPVKTSCGHIFEKICLDEWMQRKKTCPLDRISITQKNILQLDLQQKIKLYLESHPEEDDILDYKQLEQDYAQQNLSARFSYREFCQNNGRDILKRIHLISIACFMISAFIFINSPLIEQDHTASSRFGWPQQRISYLLCVSGVCMLGTSDLFINQWNTHQERRIARLHVDPHNNV